MQHFRQRRFAGEIQLDLHAQHLTYRRTTLFGGSERFSAAYRDLREPSAFYETDHQFELTAVLFAWAAIGLLAWAGYMTQGQPAGYYVGGAGLRHAITDFGPALIVMVALSALIPVLTRLRTARPYPGILFIRDKQYENILAAIEQRRIAALRALAEPDPLLMLDEQMQMLDELRDHDVISDEEHVRAVQQAEFAYGHSALDEPVIEQTEKAREYAMH